MATTDPIIADEGKEENPFVIRSNIIPDSFFIKQPNGIDVIRIDAKGSIFWRGREVETDDDFRAAMIGLSKYFMGVR